MSVDSIHRAVSPMMHLQQPLQSFPESSSMPNLCHGLRRHHFQNQESPLPMQQSSQQAYTSNTPLSWNILLNSGVRQHYQLAETSRCAVPSSPTTSQEELLQIDTNITVSSCNQLTPGCSSQPAVSSSPCLALLTGSTSTALTQTGSSHVGLLGSNLVQRNVENNSLGDHFIELAEQDLIERTGELLPQSVQTFSETCNNGGLLSELGNCNSSKVLDERSIDSLEINPDESCLSKLGKIRSPNAYIHEDSLTSNPDGSCPSNANTQDDSQTSNPDESCFLNADNRLESDLPDDVPNHPFVGYCIRHSYTLED